VSGREKLYLPLNIEKIEVKADKFEVSFKPPVSPMKFTYWLLSLFTCLLCAAALPFNDPFWEKISNDLEAWYTNNPTEKVYLHFDKPIYAVGESVWLSAYAVNGAEQTPSLLSNVLYTELLNQQGRVLQRLTLRLDQGRGSGVFTLPDTLSVGSYQVRAYTNWMRNAGEDFFFKKHLEITNPNTTTPPDQRPAPQLDQLTFFPEGGELLAGFQCRVGFKATDQYGNGIDVSGVVNGSDGFAVAKIQSLHKGIGSFKALLRPGVTYTAEVTLPNGQVKKFALPAAKENGLQLSVNALLKDSLKITVAASANLVQQQEKFYLVGLTRGKLCLALSGNMNAILNRMTVPKSLFPSGIAQLTLFNAQHEPVAERLVFINHANDKVDISVKAARQVYQKREKITLELLTTLNGEPIETEASLSVTDDHALANVSTDDHLYSSLLLTSDLKGRIENPAYYLTENAAEAVDNLLLTHGWRRFIWKDVLQNNYPTPEHSPESSLYVSGLVRNLFNKPAANANVSIIVPAKRAFTSLTTDDNGRFAITGLDVEDTTMIMLHVLGAKGGSSFDFLMDTKTYPPANTWLLPSPQKPVSLEDFVELRRKQVAADRAFQAELGVKVLKEVEVKAAKENLDATGSPRLTIHSSADHVMTGEQLEQAAIGAYNILAAIQGRIPGVQVTPNGIGGYSVQIRGVNSFMSGTTPLILLDGMPIDISMVNNINPRDVAAVEVLKGGASAAVYGSQGGNGVISILMKKGAPGGSKQQPNALALSFVGYQKVREFYAPNYDTLSQEARLKPDFRTTIYWQPRIKTNAEGKATVSFFAADLPTRYRFVVETMSAQGHLGRKEGISNEVE
jgi:TonB-dependent SusC/RagA subfamily outer membrane receptor